MARTTNNGMQSVEELVKFAHTIRHGRQVAQKMHDDDVEIRTEIYGPAGGERIKHVPVPKSPDTIRSLDDVA